MLRRNRACSTNSVSAFWRSIEALAAGIRLHLGNRTLQMRLALPELAEIHADRFENMEAIIEPRDLLLDLHLAFGKRFDVRADRFPRP